MSRGDLSSFGARLRSLRTTAGLSQVELAQAIGRHQTAIGPYERDEYVPPRNVIERMAQVLDTTGEFLFFGRNPQRSSIAVAGHIVAGGMLGPVNQESPPTIAIGAFTLREDQLIGFTMTDDEMAPAYRSGQIVLVAAKSSEPSPFLGRDCLIALADGREMLRRLAPSANTDRYDLADYHGNSIHGAAVLTVRPVWGVLHQESLSPMGNSGEK